MDSRSIFVLATAKTCPHCTDFRRNWDHIKSQIEATNLVRIIDIEVNSTSETPDLTKYPRDLSRWVRWYPTFLLFKGKSWDAAVPGPGRDVSGAVLDGSIFNGYITPLKAEFIRGSPPTRENLLDWIKREVGNMTESVSSSSILSMLAAGSTPPTTAAAAAADGYRNGPVQPQPQPNVPTSRPNIILTGNQGSDSYYVPTTGSNVCRLKLRPRNP